MEIFILTYIAFRILDTVILFHKLGAKSITVLDSQDYIVNLIINTPFLIWAIYLVWS